MKCLVCASQELEQFLDLGATALANNFPLPDEVDEPTYPLRVGFCHECGHVQLMDLVSPRAMFDRYLYVSSASDTLREHLHGLARTVMERRTLGRSALVVDVGCNDGTLLEGFRKAGATRMLGVDPAINLAGLAGRKGVDVMTAYFGPEAARAILSRHGPVSVLTMTNTFPHIPDLEGLLDGFDTVLVADGTLVIEAHYLGDLIEGLAFDTIYHEHVSYWALGPMKRLFQSHGFEIVDVERLPIHHGQLRVWIQRAGTRAVAPSVEALLGWEHARGLDEIGTFRDFAARTHALKRELRELLAELRGKGSRLAGYGAPAKGSTLLSFLGLGAADLAYIADRNPLKQGRLTPGTRIPVVSPDHLLADQPDYVLLLAWNFADEIMRQLDEYRGRGGRFVLPVPQARIEA